MKSHCQPTPIMVGETEFCWTSRFSHASSINSKIFFAKTCGYLHRCRNTSVLKYNSPPPLRIRANRVLQHFQCAVINCRQLAPGTVRRVGGAMPATLFFTFAMLCLMRGTETDTQATFTWRQAGLPKLQDLFSRQDVGGAEARTPARQVTGPEPPP